MSNVPNNGDHVTDDASFRTEPDLVPPQAKVSGGSGLSWGVALFLIFALLIVVFVVQNTANVPVKFLSWEGSFPLPLLVVVTALLAIVADEIVGLIRRRRRRTRLAEREELERYRGK
jgi:uncharacterized integral membrane protein